MHCKPSLDLKSLKIKLVLQTFVSRLRTFPWFSRVPHSKFNACQSPGLSVYIHDILAVHPGLTRVRSILFLSFEIKRVLVYNSAIFKPTDLFILYFFIENVYTDQNVLRTRLNNFVQGVKLWSKASWNIDRTDKSTRVVYWLSSGGGI